MSRVCDPVAAAHRTGADDVIPSAGLNGQIPGSRRLSRSSCGEFGRDALRRALHPQGLAVDPGDEEAGPVALRFLLVHRIGSGLLGLGSPPLKGESLTVK